MKIPAFPPHSARSVLLGARSLVPSAILLGFLACAPPLPAETVELKDQQGRTISAEVVSTEGDNVTIRREDGKEFTLPKGSFDQATQDYLAQWERKRASALRKASLPPSFGEVQPGLEELVNTGLVIGVQVALAHEGEILLTAEAGQLGTDNNSPVTSETLFVAGSCAAPFVSAMIFSMIDDPAIEIAMEDGVDKWLPAIKDATLDNDTPIERAPNFKELLNHYSGMFSTRRGFSPVQRALLADFSQDLPTLADALVTQKFYRHPGQGYATSSAGYAVAGRVAELAAGKPLEEILKEKICVPLGLEHTTYFPAADHSNIAVGALDKENTPPHMIEGGFKLAHPAVSLYTTASEAVRFAQSLLGAGNARLTRTNLRNTITSPPYKAGNFNYGWSSREKNYLSTISSFQKYRGTIKMDYTTNTVVAAFWTIRVIAQDGRASGEVFRLINAPLKDLVAP